MFSLKTGMIRMLALVELVAAAVLCGCLGMRQVDAAKRTLPPMPALAARPVTAKAVLRGEKNAVLKEFELTPMSRADGGVAFTVKLSDLVPGVKTVEVRSPLATAKKGDAGFALCQRGLVFEFNKDALAWQGHRGWLYMPYYAMKTPRDTFIAVMEGMRFEHDLLLDSVKGVYAMYPSWNIAEIGFPPYEDMTVVFYQLPLAADYNEMAKVYRSYKFTHDPAVRTLKERIKDRSELQKLADSIALRQTHTSKPWHPPSLRGRPRARLHRGRACKLHRLLYLLAALEQRRHRLPRAKRHARVQWRLERRQGVQSVPEARLGDIHARRPREGLEARLPRVPLYRRVLGRATLPLLRSEAPREQEGADARADRSGEAVPAALWRIRERVLHGPHAWLHGLHQLRVRADAQQA